MHLQIVIDTSGDTRRQFDPADGSEVAEAGKRFRDLVGDRFHRREADRKGHLGAGAPVRSYRP
jgi:hypothetical protein